MPFDEDPEENLHVGATHHVGDAKTDLIHCQCRQEFSGDTRKTLIGSY
jgi:hypothetical protein